MPTRASRKKIDYSKFNDDHEDYSDDDFQDSPNAPPAKRTKTAEKPVRKEKQISLPKLKEKNDKKRSRNETVVNKDTATSRINRKSPDEKTFERDLQLAMELSKTLSDDVILIDDDCSNLENNQVGLGKDPSGKNVSGDENEPKDSLPEAEEKSETVKLQSSSKKKSRIQDDSEEYTVDSNDDDGDGDNDYDEDDDDDDEDFRTESDEDEEFKVSKTRKPKKNDLIEATKKKEIKQKTPKASRDVSETKKAEKKSSTQVRKSASSLKNIEASRTPVSSLPKVQTGNVGLRIGLKSTNVSGGTKSPGNLLSSSGPLHSRSSPALGGVKNTGRSGIRLGLSRNIRVSKPLHASVSLKNI